MFIQEDQKYACGSGMSTFASLYFRRPFKAGCVHSFLPLYNRKVGKIIVYN